MRSDGLPGAIAFQRRPLSTLIAADRASPEGFWLQTLIAGRMWTVGTPELAAEVLKAPAGLFGRDARTSGSCPSYPMTRSSPSTARGTASVAACWLRSSTVTP